MKFLIWIFVIQAVLMKSYQCARPTYQVSIQIQNNDTNKNELTYCSGIILQKRMILTAASCVNGFASSSILVVREATNALGESYESVVREINVYPAFNERKLEHNVAILRLSTSMPLGQNEGFKWIVLGNDDPRNKFCLVNLNEENSSLGSSDIIKWKFGQPAECLSQNNATNEQCRDLTLLKFNCGDNLALTRVNMARGAGVVCDSKLYALVTRLYPIKEETTLDCHYTKANVHLTIISLYLEWIYEYIIEEETVDIIEGTYTASRPYQEEMNAPIVELTEPTTKMSTEITTPTVTTTEITSTVTTTPEITSTGTTFPGRIEHTLPEQGLSTTRSSNKRAATATTSEATTTKITTPDSDFLTRNNANVKEYSLFYLLMNIIFTFVTLKYL